MNKLLARVVGIETRAAEITHPAAMPTAALALRYGNPGQPLYPRQHPDTAVEWGYWANLYAYRCVNTIAATVAGLPFRGSAEADGHPDPTSVLGQLLGPAPGGPNAYWSSALLWRYLVAQWLVQGRFALLKQYTDGDLVGLFPLQVQGLFPIPAETGAARSATSSTCAARPTTASSFPASWSTAGTPPSWTGASRSRCSARPPARST
jgi:hypothetical protein